ncbi:MAG: PH domain-containing protein [Nocardioidaceae bacterium]|nr:PH domain-containing protein [Nocardioidaceae bacterium]
MDDLFAVPGAPWVGVSPRLASLRRWVLVGLAAVIVVALGVEALLVSYGRWLLVAGVTVLVAAVPVAWSMIGRSVASWAYAERDDDLFVRRGIMFLRCEVVPYGRMQLVDVTAGPLQRHFGVATVHLHTASPDTRARIPGLVPAEAARLRDRLTTLGEAQASGL